MYTCIIDDKIDRELTQNLVLSGVSLGKSVVIVTPEEINFNKKISTANCIILIGVRAFEYSQMRDILHECYERRCPYISIELDNDKLKHAYCDYSFFKRANAVIFTDEKIKKLFIKQGISGIFCIDEYDIWKTIDENIEGT